MGSNFLRCWFYTTNICQSIFLLVIRLYWGFLFFIGGYYKMINMTPFVGFISQLGMPSAWAYIITIFELVCGVFIFFGLLSRLAALATSLIMLGAYIIAHPAQLLAFFKDPAYFFSAPAFSFFFASLVILFFGPGIVSIDALIKKNMCCNSKK